MTKLAVDGGVPVRGNILPYARQTIVAEDIRAVVSVLESNWLTTGPNVKEFEAAFAKKVGAKYAVAVSSGTAALHAAIFAAQICPGDEVLVPAMTFVASANCVLYAGATPVIVDVEPESLLIDVGKLEQKITPKTKAIIAVDYAGQPCDYSDLKKIATKHNLLLISDACHSLGGTYQGQTVGSLSDLNIFSFHAVKLITTGEGGMITTNREDFAEKLKVFRNHGIVSDHWQREKEGSWQYDMAEMGYNYRLTDFQCALGLSQLSKLDQWRDRRGFIASQYADYFKSIHEAKPLQILNDRQSAWHLYVIQLNLKHLSADRQTFFSAMRAENIGVNVHYIPLHMHSYYRKRFGFALGLCPVAESAYRQLITLPLYPSMGDADVVDVIAALKKVMKAYKSP